MQEAPHSQLELAIIYQLEKVDQGGAVSDLFESRVLEVAKAFGLQEEDGEIILPDGSRAGLMMTAYVNKEA